MRPNLRPATMTTTVTQYHESPLPSGYVSAENLAKLGGTAMMMAQRRKRGLVVLFTDNPNFRAYWYGTNKLYVNAIFFSGLMR
jgi:hypothetical protein